MSTRRDNFPGTPVPPPITAVDYIQIFKQACRRIFKRTPSIITSCVRKDGTSCFYTSLLILPDGTRYSSYWSYTSIFETENTLCFDAMMADVRLALDEENASHWVQDEFVRAAPRIEKLRKQQQKDARKKQSGKK